MKCPWGEKSCPCRLLVSREPLEIRMWLRWKVEFDLGDDRGETTNGVTYVLWYLRISHVFALELAGATHLLPGTLLQILYRVGRNVRGHLILLF